MISTKAVEFLTKQLSIEKETVTFRWLSRKLSVHVNVAKNELASFYASRKSTDMPVHATYLLIGDVAPIKAAGSYRDGEEDVMDMEDVDQESVSTSKIVLVGEDGLEAAKAQFTRAPSIHIYSLSSSVIRDAALLAPMADRVRPDDVFKGKAHNQTIGIVVGPDVKIGQTTNSGTSKLAKTNAFTGSSSKPFPSVMAKKAAERPKSSDKGKAPEKIKQDEKKKGIDWSKAKVKGEKEQGNVASTTKALKEVVKEKAKSGLKENGDKTKPEVKKDEDTKLKVKKEPTEARINTKKVVESNKTKRGTKRPSAVLSLSDSEDDNPSPKAKVRHSATPLSSRPPSRVNGVKIKKGILLSDDDDDETTKQVKTKATMQKGKGRASIAEDEEEIEPSVRAMMDLDDSEVTRHNRAPASDHQSDEDIEMLSDEDPIPARAKVKRKPKKVNPIGKNGLPKRRVVKSKKSKNAKGYTITEDYSSYESVSESEQVQVTSDTEKKPKRGRKKPQKEEGVSGTSKARGNTNSKDKADDQAAKTEGESQTVEEKPETKKPASGSGGGGSTTKSGSKVSNGGKNNLMSYFTKK